MKVISDISDDDSHLPVPPFLQDLAEELKAASSGDELQQSPILVPGNVEVTSLIVSDSSDDSPEAKKKKWKSITEIYKRLEPLTQSQAQVPTVDVCGGQNEENLDELLNILVPPPLPPSMEEVLSLPVPQSEIPQVPGVHVSANAREAEEASADDSYDVVCEDHEDETRESDDPNLEEDVTHYSPKAEDTVKLLSEDPQFKHFIARIDKVEGKDLYCSWYYYPEEAKWGRKSFHGKAEVFSSNDKTTQLVDTVLGKCTVHTLEEYTDLEEATDKDFFSRFHYDHKNHSFTPNIVDVHCLCEMPSNPDVLMTECDHCKQWFHSQCIYRTDEEMKRIKKYICKECAPIVKAKRVAKQQRQQSKEEDIL